MPDSEDGRVVIRIVGDDSNFNQALHDAQSSAQTAGNSISGSFNGSVSAVANATRAIQQFNNAAQQTGQGATESINGFSRSVRDAGNTANTSAGSFEHIEALLQEIAASSARTAVQVENVSSSLQQTERSAEGAGSGISSALGGAALTAVKLLAEAAAAASAAFAGLTVAAVKGFADSEQYIGGLEKIFDEMDTAQIIDDAANAFKELNMSANDYMQTIISVGANFAATMGDQKGYDTARQGMKAISDYASGTGRNLEELMDKFTMITRASSSYQSIADQFSGILPATSADFLKQAKAAGLLADSYEKLTDVPIAEYQEAVAGMLERGVEALGLTDNTAKETVNTISGSVAALKAAWSDFVSGAANGNADLDTLINNFTSSFETAVNNIAPIVERAVPNMVQGLSAIGEEFADYIPQMFAEIAPQLTESGAQAVHDLIGTLTDSIEENSDTIINTALTVIDTLTDSITETAPTLSETAVEVVGKIVEGVLSRAGELVLTGVRLVESLATGLAQAMPSLLTASAEAVTDIVIELLNNVDKLIDAGFTLISGLAEGIMDALPVLIGKAPEIVTKLATELIVLAPKMLTSGIELLTQLFTGLLDPDTWGGMPDKVVKEFQDAISEIKDKVADRFTELGHDLWQALIDGWEEYFTRDFPKWEQYGADIYNQLHDGATGGHARSTESTQDTSSSSSSGGSWLNKMGIYTDPNYLRQQSEAAKQQKKNTEEQTAATEKSTEALDDNTASLEDNKKAFDEWYAEQEAALAQGKISEDEFIRNLDAKLNSASEYAGTAYTKFWNKVNAYNQKAAKEAERQADADAKKRAADEKTARDALIKQGKTDFENALADYRAGLITREQFDQEYARLQQEWKSLGISDDMSGYTDDKITDLNRDDKKKALQQQQQEEKEAKKKAVADAKEQFDRLRDQLDDGIIDREQFNAEYAKLQKEWSDKGIDITEYTEDQIYDIDHKARQKSIKDAKDAAKDELETLKKKLDAEQSEYKSKLSKLVSERDNLEKSLNSGILSVKSTTDKRSGATYKTYTIANLDKKIAARRQLGSLLSELVKKGIPKSLLSEIASADPEDALAYAKTLSSLSDAKWEDIKADYKAFEEANKAVAEAVYAPQIEALNADFKGAIGAILESASGEAQEAGAEFIAAFLVGADLTADDFPEQFKGAIDTMTDTVKKSIEDGDISKSITSALDGESIGEDIADGIAEGISSNADVISDAIEDAVNRADPDLRTAVDIVSSDRSKAAAEAPAPTAAVTAGTTPGAAPAGTPIVLNVALKWKDGRTLAEIVNTENRNITIQGGTI